MGNFTGEIAIHFPRLANVFRPHIFVFPELVVCLNCGMAEFAIPDKELHQLVRGAK
jgi:hypothetical protein